MPKLKIRLQSEAAPLRSIFISEPTENDGSLSKVDRFSVIVKIVKAILPALSEGQSVVFVGPKPSYQRLIDAVGVKTIVHIESKPYMWLQDLVEFADSDQGVGAFMSYGNRSLRPVVEAILKTVNKTANKTVNPKHAPLIQELRSEGVHGTVGGNIELWPGEVGVIGSSDFKNHESMMNFARQVFPADARIVDLPTSWLFLGHVDEVVKLIRYKKGSSCELTFLINSPKNSHPHILQSFASIREKIKSTYAKRLPNCKVQWIDAPAQYLGKVEDGEFVSRSARSMFPSLTNGILVNDTYVVADPENAEFRKMFESRMKANGFGVSFVHVGKELFKNELWDGFIHCMTQSLRDPVNESGFTTPQQKPSQ